MANLIDPTEPAGIEASGIEGSEAATTPTTSGPIPASAAPTSAFGWILVAYCVAVAAAVLFLWLDLPALSELSTLQRALIADVIATLVIFGFSTATSNASFYDAYWSVAPPFLLAFFVYAERSDAAEMFDVRLLLVSALVIAWAVRLTHNWARGWQGLDHADWRYVDLKNQTGALWWLVNLLGIHLMPTLLVFLGCIAIHVCATPNTAPLNLIDALAVLVGASAVWIEYTADNQLRQFRLNPANSGKTLSTGVWAWCRHPNYLGEIGFWVALFIFSWAAVGSASLNLAVWGPVSMIVLFVAITIPMIDKRLSARDGFEQHKANSFALLPFSHWRG